MQFYFFYHNYRYNYLFTNEYNFLLVTAQTRGATVEAAYFRHGHPITSLCRECAARHAPIVDERQENENAHISEEVIVDSVVVSSSDLQV